MHYMSYEESMRIMWTSLAGWCAVYAGVGAFGYWLYRNMTGARFKKIVRFHFWVVFLPAFLEANAQSNSPAHGMLSYAGGIYWFVWLCILIYCNFINRSYTKAYEAYLEKKVNEMPIPDEKTLKRFKYHNGLEMDHFGQIYWWREHMRNALFDPFECARVVKQGKL